MARPKEVPAVSPTLNRLNDFANFNIRIVRRTSGQESLRRIGKVPSQLLNCALQDSDHASHLLVSLLPKSGLIIIKTIHAALRRNMV